MARLNEKENKKAGKLQWFLFVIVIPILFAMTVLLVVLTFMGINPFESVKNAPVISSVVGSEDEEILEGQLEEAREESENKNHQIENLQSQVDQRDNEIGELESEIADLNEQLERREETLLSEEETIKKLSNSFSGIESNVAAEIIVEMDEQIALNLLEQMNDEERGNVLGAMEAGQAASFTDSLIQRTQ